ncbi:hypothetical protein GR160_01600 [Flavobacterium sp. Sd200]|uniref:hypothetical protein n=1 Tax=Flavobacterium sp. Sd200 TaxID=2692211 RepID=UPI00136B34E7|nr:hypothetical protein [Flavobacterium sp. Sd200]MXN89908.1 hypothetical protein [Flavobacterium sp. Sd200]
MIQKITFFILLFLPVIALSQSKCAQFREGTFKITDPKTKKVSIITRKGNVQTEKMEDAEEVYDFDIAWLDDCTYTVTPTPATAARVKDISKVGTMTVEILKAKDSSYTQRVKVASNPNLKRTDTVFMLADKE